MLLLAFLIGLEAQQPQALDPARGTAGRAVDVVAAPTREEAESRSLRALARRGRADAPRAAPAGSAGAAPARPEPVIGLFPEAERAAVSVAIIDYGSGNLHSAAKAFERAAREAGLDATDRGHRRSGRASRSADRIVLPGVGAFADCRRGLDAVPGMVEALTEAVREQGPAVPRHLRRHAAHGDAAASNTRPPPASTGSRAT